MKPRWWAGDEPRALADEGTEVWARIPEAERYAVSNLGRVASVAQGTWKLLTQGTVGSGYRAVGILNDQGNRNGGTLVHRLAVLAFDGDPPTAQHTDVRHLDGDKANNALSNLLWGTRSENMRDVLLHRQGAEQAGAQAAKEVAEATGTWYGGRTWDEALVEAVLELEREGYLTGVQAAKLLGVSADVVSNIGRRISHTHLSVPSTRKQRKRGKHQKDAIQALVDRGLNAAQINAELGEDLTAQAVYYYRTRSKT